jgi:putative transposase
MNLTPPIDHFRRKILGHLPPFWIDTSSSKFFLTICLKDRRGLSLCENTLPATILDSIRHYNDIRRWWTSFAVVMPDHVHLICSFPGESDMFKVIADWKRWNARKLGLQWQYNFFDHRLRNDDQVAEKVRYVLENPVRAGFVSRWEDWPYKLVERYEERDIG